MSKSLTKDCKTCKEFNIDDNYNFTCKWGKRKKVKIIRDDGYTSKKCKLIKPRKENDLFNTKEWKTPGVHIITDNV